MSVLHVYGRLFRDYAVIYMMPFGPHVNRYHATSTKATIIDHIRVARDEARAAGFDMTAAQVFVSNPRKRELTMTAEARELRQYIQDEGMTVVAHGSYLDAPWKASSSHAAWFIRRELELCDAAGISGLVIHLNHLSPEETSKRLPLMRAKTDDVVLYLEMPHLLPARARYVSAESIEELFRRTRESYDSRLQHVGFCIDTAHMWSSGVDIASYKDAEAWLDAFRDIEDVLPPSRVMLHLNDSAYERGKGLDAHAPLTDGEIWRQYKERPHDSGLQAFADYALANETITILERKPKEALISDYVVLTGMAPTLRYGN